MAYEIRYYCTIREKFVNITTVIREDCAGFYGKRCGCMRVFKKKGDKLWVIERVTKSASRARRR